MVDVRIKRIYDEPEPSDGYRVLIDHVWPRGVSRERAHLDEWARELAPGDELKIRFQESVSCLAQLPGGNFYRRIREKFGKLA